MGKQQGLLWVEKINNEAEGQRPFYRHCRPFLPDDFHLYISNLNILSETLGRATTRPSNCCRKKKRRCITFPSSSHSANPNPQTAPLSFQTGTVWAEQTKKPVLYSIHVSLRRALDGASWSMADRLELRDHRICAPASPLRRSWV
uniref:Uncharacterized protein n=1 Tax=Anguilla anguilla TaxID=7936 RepID=A0A0E9X0W7_ANGAN